MIRVRKTTTRRVNRSKRVNRKRVNRSKRVNRKRINRSKRVNRSKRINRSKRVNRSRRKNVMKKGGSHYMEKGSWVNSVNASAAALDAEADAVNSVEEKQREANENLERLAPDIFKYLQNFRDGKLKPRDKTRLLSYLGTHSYINANSDIKREIERKIHEVRWTEGWYEGCHEGWHEGCNIPTSRSGAVSPPTPPR